MLNLLNTISGKEFANECPSVQIIYQFIYQSNKNSYLLIKAIKSVIGCTLKLEEKRKYIFTIILNIHAGYKSAPFKQK